MLSRFYSCKRIRCKALSWLILDTLKSYRLDIGSCLVGQSYNGTCVMRGLNKGVQQMVSQSTPLAIYVHCYAHKLDLILVDACKSVPEAVGISLHYLKGCMFYLKFSYA